MLLQPRVTSDAKLSLLQNTIMYTRFLFNWHFVAFATLGQVSQNIPQKIAFGNNWSMCLQRALPVTQPRVLSNQEKSPLALSLLNPPDTRYITPFTQMSCAKCQNIMYVLINYDRSDTMFLWPPYRSTYVSWYPQLKTRGFCWSNILLPTCPCWQQQMYSH